MCYDKPSRGSSVVRKAVRLGVFPYVCSRGWRGQGFGGSRQHTVFDQPTDAEGHLPPFRRNFHDGRSADGTAQRPGIALDGPAGDRDLFGAVRFLFHGHSIGRRLENLKG